MDKKTMASRVPCGRCERKIPGDFVHIPAVFGRAMDVLVVNNDEIKLPILRLYRTFVDCEDNGETPLLPVMSAGSLPNSPDRAP